jgi:exodeoxyribonuclease V alpha subunit
MIRFREVVEAEAQIAADLYERSTAGPDWEPFDPTPFLERLQEGSEFKLGQEQVDAVRMVCQHGTSVMTGGPGVGKTTTLKKTVEALERAGVNVLLMAPTGIAAKRMRESTGRHASTVHSAIGRLGNRSEDDEPLIPSDAPTCLVIDESSMVNVFTLQKLLAPLPASVSILFSGDVDQLPSIGPGQVLRDLIESGMVPVSRLDTVYRQGPDSEIIHAARAINAGKMPEVKNDFRIIPANTPEEIRDEVIRQVRQVSAIKGFDVKKDLMVLAPVKKGPAGVVSLNTELQELLNPPSKYKAEISVPRPPENEDESDLAEELMTDRERARAERAKKEKVHHEILRVGDRVIHTRNNYENGLVNGDVGIITSVNPQHREVCVEFNDEPYVLDRDGLNDIRLAYAMTVHKSQGSEAKYVIAPLPPNYTFMLNRNLLYTGVTRGKRTVTVIGSEESVRACVETTAESSADLARHSTLKEHCRALMRAEIELRAEDIIDEIGVPDMS